MKHGGVSKSAIQSPVRQSRENAGENNKNRTNNILKKLIVQQQNVNFVNPKKDMLPELGASSFGRQNSKLGAYNQQSFQSRNQLNPSGSRRTKSILSEDQNGELALRNQYNSTDAPQQHGSKKSILRKSVGLNKTLYTSIMNGSFGPSVPYDGTSNSFMNNPLDAAG